MTEPSKILIVDDEADLRELLVERLSGHEFSAVAVGGGQAMFEELAREKYDLILLDVMMPGEDGLSLCRKLRASGTASSRIPIIFLTALGETTDRIVGLELGADDYLPKPFETRELLARMRAVLRRITPPSERELPSASASPSTDEADNWLFDAWELNSLARHLVDSEGRVFPLSAAEYRLLVYFLNNPGRVLTRDQIMDHVAGRSADVFDRSIDVQISRLRGKLRDNGKEPRIIRTMRGDGYVLSVTVKRKGAA